MRVRRAGGLISVLIIGALAAHVGTAQNSGRNPDWDWPTYNHDLASTRMTVPFLDLKVDSAEERAGYLAAIDRILQHGRILNGPEIDTTNPSLKDRANSN